MREKASGPNDSLTAASRLTVGAMLRREGHLADAEQDFRSGLAILDLPLRRAEVDAGRAVVAALGPVAQRGGAANGWVTSSVERGNGVGVGVSKLMAKAGREKLPDVNR